MYWSHAAVETYKGWLEENRLEINAEHFIPEGTSGHSLLLARKHPDENP
jgi:hypothetical protein